MISHVYINLIVLAVQYIFFFFIIIIFNLNCVVYNFNHSSTYIYWWWIEHDRKLCVKLKLYVQSSVKSIGKCKKKIPLNNQPKPYFFKKLLWSHFWIDFNKFYTKTFRIVNILIVDLLIGDRLVWVVGSNEGHN